MDYQTHYNSLIERAKTRLLEGYVEKHHIVPKCMNGTDDIDNLVPLTPEEHYVAHQLLVKIWPNELKLVYAAKMMTVGCKNQRNNKLYGWLRRKYSELGHSEETKKKIGDGNRGKKRTEEVKKKMNHKGKNNPMYGRKHSEETKQKMQKPKSEEHKEKLRKPKSEETRQKLRKIRMKQKPPMLGKKHTDEAKRKMSEASKGRFKGKTYEEIYGIKKAKELRQKKSESLKRYYQTHGIK